ncbi:NlpC/P60 family protein, partial [Streptomyces sp. NPDC097981]|uniref:NlpC/P60 family protein n=1 Tax=Streptomyces sp. NPDC097981 TaxID=3155428 RepID=UPI0033278949
PKGTATRREPASGTVPQGPGTGGTTTRQTPSPKGTATRREPGAGAVPQGPGPGRTASRQTPGPKGTATRREPASGTVPQGPGTGGTTTRQTPSPKGTATRREPGAGAVPQGPGPGRTSARHEPSRGDTTTRQTPSPKAATTRPSPSPKGTATRRGPGAGAVPQGPGSGGTAIPQGNGSGDVTARQGNTPGGAAPQRNAPEGTATRRGPGAGAVPQGPGSGGTATPQGNDPADATARQGNTSGGAAPQGTGSGDGAAGAAGAGSTATPQAAASADAAVPQGTGSGDGGVPSAPGKGGGGAGGAPQGPGVGELLARLQGLYRQAEAAAEAYNATEAALKAGQDEERRLSAELGKARTALGAEKAAAGRMAREQYRDALGFSPYARMLLTGDVQAAQDQRRLAAREGARRAGVLARLTRGERRADALATSARKSLDARQILTAQRRLHKQEADLKLKQVERLLASLSAGQLARLGSREAADTATAQRELLDSGRLAATALTPTAAGGAALTYAAQQIGKPYVWGAEGPGSFDCSGLTSQAWAHAGRSIPRTSQEQWAQLPKVPLNKLRPGDLVVYFPTATHVALYVGDGKVIHAPRPGAKVKVSPIAANPLLGAVRPDPDGAPLAGYTAPPLSAAADGGDTGYSSQEAPADEATSAT